MIMELPNPSLELAQVSLREQFGITLKEIGGKNENIVVLDADLSSSTRTKYFAQAYPERFFNIGIAEQNMIGVAMGLANSGKISVVSGFSCFTIGRAWEYIRSAAFDNLPVKICTSHAGLSASQDGGSHQALEDISLMSVIPGVRIFCPCDPIETDQMLRYLIQQPGVYYLRLMRLNMPWVWSKNYKFEPNHPDLVYESKDDDVKVTIFSTGSMTCYTPPIANLLVKKGYSIRIVHFGTVKPLNQEQIRKYCSKTELLVTMEEHNTYTGFGSQISRVVSEINPCALLVLGIDDQFGQSGNIDQLYERYNLTPTKIVSQIINKINNSK